MLKIPFKETESLVFDLRKEILILGEDPKQYSEDIQAINNLRTKIMDPSKEEYLIEYYVQICYLEQKLKPNVIFTWKNAFGLDWISSDSFGFEKASVLFNLGALYSRLAATEDLKTSALYYQKSSGIYATILEKLPNWNIQGSANTQISALSFLQLAQAQEVFYTKAVLDKMKPGTVAKLAAQVAIFYQNAVENASSNDSFNQAWINHMKAKNYYFSSLAAMHKAQECHEIGKYGLQVSWLQAALEKSQKSTEKSILKNLLLEQLISVLQGHLATIETKLASAIRDNDRIYMEPVPKIEDLDSIPAAKMVNPIPLPLFDELAKGIQPVFKNMVPMAVHEQLSKYSYQKDLKVRKIIDNINEYTFNAHSTLASLNLPGIIEAIEQPLGIPNQVLKRSQEVRQMGGSEYIKNTWETVLAFSKSDRDILNHSVQLLNDEEKQDEQLRNQYGEQWDRTESSLLNRNLKQKANEYLEKLNAAEDSNSLVKQKFEASLFLIESLSMNQNELEASIPASKIDTSVIKKDPNLISLKKNLSLLNENIKNRRPLIEELDQLAKEDDIAPRLTENVLLAQPKSEEEVFEIQLAKYKPITNKLNALVKEQAALLDQIRREEALSNLELGYQHFIELKKNLDEGAKFFMEIENVLITFSGVVNDYVEKREIDKKRRLERLSSLNQNSGFQGAAVPGLYYPNPNQINSYGQLPGYYGGSYPGNYQPPSNWQTK